MNNKVKYISILLNELETLTDQNIYHNGKVWYYEANKVIKAYSKEFKIKKDVIAQIISTLSPCTSWQQNKKDAYNMLIAFKANKDINSFKVTTYGNNKIEAWNILHGREKLNAKSLKTFSFYNNLLLNSNFVTLDVWMLRLLQFEKEYITPKQYNDVTTCFKIVSYETNLNMFEIQSILWCKIRGSYI